MIDGQEDTLRAPARGYAARLIEHGTTVNAVAPSLIATDMIADQLPQNGGDRANRLRGARVGTVQEVASTVVMVVGNAYMAGQTVLLNGGRAFL